MVVIYFKIIAIAVITAFAHLGWKIGPNQAFTTRRRPSHSEWTVMSYIYDLVNIL